MPGRGLAAPEAVTEAVTARRPARRPVRFGSVLTPPLLFEVCSLITVRSPVMLTSEFESETPSSGR